LKNKEKKLSPLTALEAFGSPVIGFRSNYNVREMRGKKGTKNESSSRSACIRRKIGSSTTKLFKSETSDFNIYQYLFKQHIELSKSASVSKFAGRIAARACS
jgi:hypothetical protein